MGISQSRDSDHVTTRRRRKETTCCCSFNARKKRQNSGNILDIIVDKDGLLVPDGDCPSKKDYCSVAGVSVSAKRETINPSFLYPSSNSPSDHSSPTTPISYSTDSSDFKPLYANTNSEMVSQLLSCFPFPTPKSSPVPERKSPNLSLKRTKSVDSEPSRPKAHKNAERSYSVKGIFNNNKKMELNSGTISCDAIEDSTTGVLEKLALVSVDTMAITALPLNYWLEQRLKKWVQLSGHEGTIIPASDRTLWKRKSCCDYNEANAYREIMNDRSLKEFVPQFYKELQYKNEFFIEIEDLTAHFDSPCIMDIKMGIRTFSEGEVQNSTKRSDLYKKMVEICPDEPTSEEHMEKAITKMRYMQFREAQSSTANFGFRIEAAKMPGGLLHKNFKQVKSYSDISKTLWTFFGENMYVKNKMFRRLLRLREALQSSKFFSSHEIVGSSLLLIHDSKNANVWMIDFAKSLPIEDRLINHRIKWKPGNHEDGYFIGLDNLIQIIGDLSP